MHQASPEDQRAPARATFLVFAAFGLVLATWSSRIPQIRAALHLAPSTLGLLLLCIAAGSLVTLPFAGPLAARIGARAAVSAAGVGGTVGMLLAAVGVGVHELAVTVVGLLVMGLATGIWDVCANIQAAWVEQQIGQPLMARFHSGYSIGTVLGALIGVLMIAVGVSAAVDIGAVSLVIGISVPWFARHFIGRGHGAAMTTGSRAGQADRVEEPPPRTVWRERRTLLLGLLVASFALVEGAGNDWIGVSMISGHHSAAAVGTLAYGTFLTAMTLGRWFGPQVVARRGRALALSNSACLAIVGLVVYIFVPSIAAAFVAVFCWGAGTALGFPLGISAAADGFERAHGRVGVATSVGYLGLLGGPPLIGLLAGAVTVIHALCAVIVVLFVALALTPVTRPALSASAGLRTPEPVDLN